MIGVVGTYNSGVAAAVLPDFESAGIALVSPGNTNPSLTLGDDRDHPMRPYDNYFRMVANDAQQGGFLAEAAIDLGIDAVAVVTDEKPVSQGLANDFRAAFVAAGGTILSFEVVPEGDTNYAAVRRTRRGDESRVALLRRRVRSRRAAQAGCRRGRSRRAADGRRRRSGRRVHRRGRRRLGRRSRQLRRRAGRTRAGRSGIPGGLRRARL